MKKSLENERKLSNNLDWEKNRNTQFDEAHVISRHIQQMLHEIMHLSEKKYRLSQSFKLKCEGIVLLYRTLIATEIIAHLFALVPNMRGREKPTGLRIRQKTLVAAE